MDYATVLVERRGAIGLVKLDGPQRNALSARLMADLTAALHELDADPEVRAIVIMSNNPKAFCVGRDLAEGFAATDTVKQREISSGPGQLWLTLRSLKKITIGAVNGFAVAGGTGLAVACDLAIAAEDAVFGLTEINVGLFPTTIAPSIARNTTSLKKCLELFLTGDRFSAKEAEALGLINRVVPAAKLEETVLELAGKIAAKSPSTLQAGKQFYYNMLDMEYGRAVDYATDVLTIIASSDDGKEGQKAFLEKRPPVWKKPNR